MSRRRLLLVRLCLALAGAGPWGCADGEGDSGEGDRGGGAEPLGAVRQATVLPPLPPPFNPFRQVTIVPQAAAEVSLVAPVAKYEYPSRQAELLGCEEPLTAGAQRPECPSEAPTVEPCAEEGRECRYEDGKTVETYQCLFGLWSRVDVLARDEWVQAGTFSESGSGELVDPDPACATLPPLADSPCSTEALRCGYDPCGLVSSAIVVYECRCGRWLEREGACLID